MQALTNKLVSGKSGWPPRVEVVLRQGVLICLGIGIPISGLLYDSLQKGKCEQSVKERERIAGIIRAMMKKSTERKKNDFTTCSRIASAIKAAQEEGESEEQLLLWRTELNGRVAAALQQAVDKKVADEKSVTGLVRLLEKSPGSWETLPRPLNRSIRRMLRASFYKRLRTGRLIIKCSVSLVYAAGIKGNGFF
eukprot:jgi/Bigna1/144698/aug1.90_g19406